MDKESYHHDLKNKWKMFIHHGWASEGSVNSVTLRSWQKCLKHCDPRRWKMPIKASGQTLQTILSRNGEFIRVSRRVVEDHFTLVSGDEVALVVLDPHGWTLEVQSAGELATQLQHLGVGVGMSWAEEEIGTNVYSLCRDTHLYTRLEGAEHFSESLHAFSMSAAAVIDYCGNVHGYIVCIVKASADTHYLHLSHACGVEVANFIYIENEQKNTNKVLCQHNAVIECMDDGFICWDAQTVITMINPQAQLLLNVKQESLIGKNIRNEFVFPPALNEAISQRTKLPQKQIVIEYRGEFIELMVTLRPLSDGSFLLFLHPLDKIRKIAQQQISTNANFTFDSLHVISKGMKQVLSVARRAIKTASPILINGEEGVGKLSMAMAIHNESEQRDGPFISVDCQMLSPENMLHELLGSDAGPVPSKFELAQNGTLYLDKVEYLSSEIQSVLLKVLKTGLVMRSDSHRLIPVRFRLITCTGSSLRDYVQQGAFSRQLYYEISMSEIEIPPLRKRRDDLEYMINEILEKYRNRTGKTLTIATEAKSALLEYLWPGNISEFKNRMEKIFMGCGKLVLELEDIPLDIRQNNNCAADDVSHLISLAEVEMQAIEHVCRVCDWNLSKAADVLKIGRTTLWRKLKNYNLYPGPFNDE
ncbi:dihydroxyacetone kinase operon transcriptional regulator DhaR [[Enterobacter] lignolyticus]|uniref:Sigma54 specific transcriptional regulator with PAS/PAC sensor, Fis family n=2 Tax=[Enterobacter] lignolyticus TaxID=1334193 RepID=E3G873_ENTLS|nr:dihydroxyacetone kinase operon transcriptional regulator DhaR [[Enterobacter] lignolyticus]ADO49741.1 sigma54 specific transcriptional regulator with PAS/PAC sensor, Fis family [[Enterobacter] lignolyticus SCF1]ALR75580.1 AAA family ATPase [[Enterobacter] lignolyticus]